MYRASGPSAHALAQQCCVNVAKRVQHHATSKMLHEKFDRFQIWSNIIQHDATHRNISQQGGQTYATCCAQQCCKMLRWNVASVWPGLKDLTRRNLCLTGHCPLTGRYLQPCKGKVIKPPLQEVLKWSAVTNTARDVMLVPAYKA